MTTSSTGPDDHRLDWFLAARFGMFIVNHWPGSTIAIDALENRVLTARLMNRPELSFSQSAGRIRLTGLPETAPDPLLTVIELDVEGQPPHSRGIGCGVPSIPPGPLAWE